MTARRLRLLTADAAGAQATLAERLPRLDTQFIAAGEDTVLLPPLVWQALEREYGTAHLTKLLTEAGLQDAGPVALSDAVHWAAKGALASPQAIGHVFAEGAQTFARFLTGDDAADTQWQLTQCQVQKAWSLLGLDPQAPRIDWQDICVGHVDTGYTPHPALGFTCSPWVDVARARSFEGTTSAPDAQDPMRGVAAGHGTGSGSLCCGADPDQPYFGVAPRVPLVPVRVADCYILDKRAVEFESAVTYLVEEVKAPIINVSMGTFLKRQAPVEIARAVDLCYENGVILIAAAGNVPAPGWPAFPAALPRSIAVAGVTRQGRHWAVSSSGDWVDFSGPGKQVPRAHAEKTSTGLQYSYTETIGGTTFATAMTSGAAALWLHRHRAEVQSRYGSKPWQIVEAFRAMARITALPPAGWDPNAGFGTGVLNVAGLMEAGRLPPASSLVKR